MTINKSSSNEMLQRCPEQLARNSRVLTFGLDWRSTPRRWNEIRGGSHSVSRGCSPPLSPNFPAAAAQQRAQRTSDSRAAPRWTAEGRPMREGEGMRGEVGAAGVHSASRCASVATGEGAETGAAWVAGRPFLPTRARVPPPSAPSNAVRLDRAQSDAPRRRRRVRNLVTAPCLPAQAHCNYEATNTTTCNRVLWSDGLHWLYGRRRAVARVAAAIRRRSPIRK